MAPYERLLGDAMRGDQTLFAREDTALEAWRVVEPVLGQVTPLHEYEPGTWGPAEADRLLANGQRLAQPGPGVGLWRLTPRAGPSGASTPATRSWPRARRSSWRRPSARRLRRDGRGVLALSGGSTPRGLYQRLAGEPWRRAHRLGRACT